MLVASTLHWSPKKTASDSVSKQQLQEEAWSQVTAVCATSLMCGNIMLPGFATADNLLGAHSTGVAGEGSG